MHMKEKSNFAVTSEGIEILTKKGIVEILTSYIEKINITTYSFPFTFEIRPYSDNNMNKDITTIKIILKDDVDLDEFKIKGLYYNLFNYRKNKKTGKTSFYLYEIMYGKESENNIAFFREKFCDFL